MVRDPDQQRRMFEALPWCNVCRGTGSLPDAHEASGEGYCTCERAKALANHDRGNKVPAICGNGGYTPY